MTTSKTSRNMLIDSRFVVEEVVIDRETSFYRTMSKDFRLDLFFGGHLNN
jgi:hypothetical protein